MERTPLRSSALLSAGYDDDARTLEVEFRSGRVYRYRGVPRGVFDFLVRTPEKGRFFNRMINGVYEFDDTAVVRAEQDLADALRASLAVHERDHGR